MNQVTLPAKIWPWLLTAAILIAFFLHLQGVPLFDLDEGAFSEATREMLTRHDFLTTYLNGEPRYAKPILTYWLQAVSVSLFGVHTFAFRLPSSLAATAWVLSVFAFVRPRLGRETAYTAALITALSAGVAVVGRAAIADALLNLFITLSFFDIYRYHESRGSTPRNRAFIWMALGFLTKGPIAMVAAPVSLLFFLWQGRWKDWLKAAFSPLGWALFLAITAPWYILEYLHQGKAFIDSFFLKNNLGRYASPNDSHAGDYFYYVGAVLLMLMPFSGWLIRILPRLANLRREVLDRYLWIGFGFVFLFFTFSATKLPHYILYGCTPLFILLAKYREEIRGRFFGLGPAILFLAFVLALPLIASQVAQKNGNAYIRAMLSRGPEVFNPLYYLVPALALAVILLLWVWPRWPVWQKSLLASLLCTFVLMQTLVPTIGALKQQPVKNAALLDRHLSGPTVMWEINMPSFSVYRQAVTPRAPPKPGDLVFTRIDKLPRLAKLGHYRVLFNQGGIILARFLGPGKHHFSSAVVIRSPAHEHSTLAR